MMKHTNSGIPENGTELGDIEVIENDNYASIHQEQTHKPNVSPETKTHGKDTNVSPETKTHGKDTNGKYNQPGNIDHENYNLPRPKPDIPTTKAKHYNKPVLPRVLIALIIILLMAVIALSFVLYHLDQQLVNTKEKTDAVYEAMTRDGEVILQLKKKAFGNNKTLKSIQENYTKDILQLKQRTSKNDKSLRLMQQEYEDGVSALNKSAIKSDIVLEKDIIELKNKTNKNQAKIFAVEKVFKKDISHLGNKSIELNETVLQLDMYIQFKEYYERKIGLTFKDVIKLAGGKNRVIKPMSHMILLTYQFNQYTTKYEKQWGINYTDVIRLTDRLDFKVNKKIPLLEKIQCLYSIFNQQFQKIWNITFNDLIRLTTKVDIAAMTLPQWIHFKVSNLVPLLLQKIEHMYQQFNKTYHQKWGITFKDVISLTEKIDFQVNETVPILQEIDSWYFEGFKEIWGNGFPGYIHVMMSSKGINRTEIFKKLQYIKSQGNHLKFLPGSFEFNKGRLSVYGYVAIYRKSNWGLIKNGNLRNEEAKVICKTGNYTNGVYDKGKYNVGNMKRDSLEDSIGFLNCVGNEDNVDKCKDVAKGNPWEHKDDAGVKCYF